MPPLPEKEIEFPFTGPLDEKSGPFSQDPRSAAEMTNLVRVKTGEVQVRDGWQVEGDIDVSENSTQLINHRNRPYGIGPHFIQHEQAKLDHVPEFTVLKDVGITGGVAANIIASDIAFFQAANADVGYWFQVASVLRSDDTVDVVCSQYEVSFDGASKLVHEHVFDNGALGKVQVAARTSGVVVAWEDGTNIQVRTFQSLLGVITSGTPVTDYVSDGGSFYLQTFPDAEDATLADDYFIAYTRDGGTVGQTLSTPGYYTIALSNTYLHTISGWGGAGAGGGAHADDPDIVGGDGGAGGFAEAQITGTETLEVFVGEGGNFGTGETGSAEEGGGGGSGGALVAAWLRVGNVDISATVDGTTDLTSFGLNQVGAANWQVDSGGTPTANTGPADGCNIFTSAQSAGAKYLYAEATGEAANTYFTLETDTYDTTDGAPVLYLQHHMYFDTNIDGVLHVDAWNGTGWTNIITQIGPVAASNAADYTPWFLLADGAQYRSATFKWRIRFIRGLTSDTYDCAIANLKWGTAVIVAGAGGGGGGAGDDDDNEGDGRTGGGGGGVTGDGPAGPAGVGHAGGIATDGNGVVGSVVGGAATDISGGDGGDGADGGAFGTGGGGGGGSGVAGGAAGSGGGYGPGTFGGNGGSGGTSYSRDGIVSSSVLGVTAPPQTGHAGYVSGHGVGGAGATGGSGNQDGTDGGDGLLVYAGTSLGFVVRRLSAVDTALWTQLVSTNTEIPCCSLDLTETQNWVAWYRPDQTSYAILANSDGNVDLAETIVAAREATTFTVPHVSIKVRSDGFAIVAWSELPNIQVSPNYAKQFRWAKMNNAGAQSYQHNCLRMLLVSQLFEDDGRIYAYTYIGDRGQDHDYVGSPVVSNPSSVGPFETPTGDDTTAVQADPDENGAIVRPSPYDIYALIDLRAGSSDEVVTAGSVMPRLVGLISNDDAWYPISKDKGYGENVTSHVAVAPLLDYRYAVSLPRWRDVDVNNIGSGVRRSINTDVIWLRVNDPALWRWAEVGQAISLPSSLPSIFDGFNFTEVGFAHPPEILQVSGDGFAGHPTGYIAFIAVYAFEDEYGNIYRSKPSTPVYLNITTQASAFTALVTPLCITNRQDNDNGFRDGVSIELYRTLDGAPGGPFYRTAQVVNDPFTEFLELQANDNDIRLSEKGETLYTDGELGLQPLSNEPPDPARYVISWRNRVWLCSDRNLWYSQQRVEGEGLRFNAILREIVEEERGNLTGLAVMDGALLVAQRDRWYIVHGDGPDESGAGGTFSLQQQLSINNGCIAGEHIVVTPYGLVFRSARGWFLLGRNLSETYLSAPIEDTLEAFPVTKFAIKDREHDWVYIGVTNTAGTSGRLLRFDLYHQQWAVDILPVPFLSGVQTLDDLLLLDSSANTRHAVPSVGDSSTEPVAGTYVTPWYVISNKIGWFRARRVFLLCRGREFEHPGTNTITVEAGYNYRSEFRPLGLHSVRAVEGSEGIRMRFKPSPQPVTSIRFRVTVMLQTTTSLQSGSPASLVSLMMRYAAPFPAARLGRNTSHKASEAG